jgi:transglutaminase-like putative cysteine protease
VVNGVSASPKIVWRERQHPDYASDPVVGETAYAPMDFAAWIEVYLGGRWHTFDPRNNAPRIGRVLIAHGRDAADVPLTHIFGPGTLWGFRVWAEEAPVTSVYIR